VNVQRPTRLPFPAACAAVTVLSLAFATVASAHARISPPVSLSNTIRLYSLAVPTEQARATTVKVVLDVPAGFAIDSFVPSPGWHRLLQESVSRSGAVVQRVTWTGGHTPTGEDAFFQFLGEPSGSGTFAFPVEQTYSNGVIVDWSGSAAAADPEPTIEVESSLGGGTSTLTIVALVVAGLGVVIGALALLVGGGARQLA
jgi:uncharacterized protein YcnI